jgi:hypothetical protein
VEVVVQDTSQLVMQEPLAELVVAVQAAVPVMLLVTLVRSTELEEAVDHTVVVTTTIIPEVQVTLVW